jgi:ATP-grasp domain, R2K clade family 3
MSNLHKIHRKLKGKKAGPVAVEATAFQRINRVLEFALPDEIHSAYAPESPYVTTQTGRKIKSATTKAAPRQIYTRGEAPKWRKKPTEHGYELEPFGGKPRGSPLYRSVIRHPETGEKKIHPSYVGKLGAKTKEGWEVIGRYPVYSGTQKGGVERFRPRAYLAARYETEGGKLREEMRAKAAPEMDIKRAERVKRKEILGEYLKTVQEEAGGRRLGGREIRDRTRQLVNREILAHRNYRAGELREARAITHARKVPLITARAHPEIMSEHVGRLGELVEKKKEAIGESLSGKEKRLHGILSRGVAKTNPLITPHTTPEEISTRASDLLRPLSHKTLETASSLEPEQRAEIARTLQAGLTKSRAPVTPERVEKLRTRLNQQRNLLDKPSEGILREQIIKSGELFKGIPKVTKPVSGYPFLKKAGIGVGVAAGVAGGAYLAKRLLYPKRKELNFGLPPDEIAKLDFLANKMKKLVPFVKPRPRDLPRKTRIRNVIRWWQTKQTGKILRAMGKENAPTYKKMYKEQVEKTAAGQAELRKIADERVAQLREENEKARAVSARIRSEGYEAGHSLGRQEEAARGKRYREEQVSKVRQDLGAQHSKRVSRLKWTAGGIAGGAGVGGYLIGRGRRQRDHEFSVWSNLRDKISGHHDEGPSPYHDIATGAIEGGLAFPASEWAYKKLIGKGAPSTLKKIAVGGAVGGAATGLIGVGIANILRGKKKLKSKQTQMRARLREIRFQRLPQRNQRTLVARDRYIKQIKERDIDIANKHYIHSALLGAGIGAVLTKNPRKLAKSVLGGAAAGLGVQKATRIYGATTRDQFGERSYVAKRVERVPTIAGIAGIGYAGLKRVRALSSRGRPIYFQEDGYDPNDPLTKLSRKWLYKKDYSTAAHAQKIRKWGGRTKRIATDIRQSREGIVPVDARGRPRKREWEKPWVAAVGTIAALKGGIWGVNKLRGVVRAAPIGSRLGQLREGFLTGDYAKKLPGLQKIGGFYQGVKSDLGRLVYKPAEHPKYDVSRVNPTTGKMKSPKTIEREQITADEKKLLKSIAEGKTKKTTFKPGPGSTHGFSVRSRLIQFKEKWVDNPLYPKDQKRSIQEVPIKHIVSHQDAVKEGTVKKYKKRPGRALPTLHKVGKKYYVEDGNHRIVSKMEKGEKTVRASVREQKLSARLREIRFAQAVPYWDIRDERGKSARVYAPGSQRRYREPMPEWKRKRTQRHILEGVIAGTALLGGVGAIAAGRRGFRVGREVEKRAHTIGSTGHAVAYHTGERLEPIEGGPGFLSWVRKPKPPEAPSVPFSSRLREIRFDRHSDTKKKLLTDVGVGAGALGAGAGVYGLLRRPGKIPVRGAVKAIRETAQRHGFARVHWHDKPGLAHKIYSRIAEPADIHADVISGRAYFPRHTKAVVFDPESTGKLRSPSMLGKMNKTATGIRKSKLAEYRIAKRMGLNIPETAPLGDPKTLGARWIAKPATGSMSKALTAADFAKHDPLHPDLVHYKIHKKELRPLVGNEYYKADARLSHHPGAKRYHVEQALKHPERYVRQRKLDIKKEYRVHMIGGEPLGVSSARHSVRQFFLNRNKPAEAAAAAMMKNVHPKLKKNLLAMDIVRTKKGGWHVIETNPGSDSGFLTPTSGSPIDIRGPHALYKSVTGRHSKLVAGTAGAATAAGVGVAGGTGALIAQRKKSQS